MIIGHIYWNNQKVTILRCIDNTLGKELVEIVDLQKNQCSVPLRELKLKRQSRNVKNKPMIN
jgi:hypothetical protein